MVRNDYDLPLLDLYRRGKLHSVSCVCSTTFHTDLEYWGIDKLLLDACCAMRHYPEMEMRRREYEASKKHLERMLAQMVCCRILLPSQIQSSLYRVFGTRL